MAVKVKTFNFPEFRSIGRCLCSDDAAVFEIDGREFIGKFDGSISVRVGQHRTDKRGALVMPLDIVGYSTQSDVPGLGKTSLDFNFDKPIGPSQLKGASDEELFPAVQTMRLNILMTTEGMPGITLESGNIGVLVNRNVDNFPPSVGSVYTLQRPVELKSIDGASGPNVRLVSVNTRITSVVTSPEELIVGNGLRLYPQQENFSNVLSRFSPETSITFSLEHEGHVQLSILNRRGGAVLKVIDEEKSSGQHTVLVDGARLKGREYYYQIRVNGKKRTAKMLLVSH